MIFSLTVKPVVNTYTSTVVANFKEDMELVCAISAGNPWPAFEWESQAHSCLTTECEPEEDQWKAVSQVSFMLLNYIYILLK